MFKSTFTLDDVQVMHRTAAYQGYFKVDKIKVRHRLFSGSWSSVLTREVVDRGDSVAVLLFDPELNRLVLIEQFRPGLLGKTKQPWQLEIVAGAMEEGGECTPEEVAKREIQEETGLKVLELLPICEYWASSGSSNEKLFLFCGRTRTHQAESIHGLATEGEDICARCLDVSVVYDYLKQGFIQQACAIVSLQWFQLNEEILRRHWQ